MKALDYIKVGAVGRYFIRVFRKPGADEKGNINLRLMHGINKITIVVFFFGVLVMLYRAFLR